MFEHDSEGKQTHIGRDAKPLVSDLDIKKTDVTEDALVLKRSTDTSFKMQAADDMGGPSRDREKRHGGFVLKPK
ncbi:hypothetical protein [Granulicella sibirica]|nr:hypothetical protein [Granulicella sibirica]